MARPRAPGAWLLASMALLAGPAAAQDDDPTHEPDRAAAEAFERVVESYRKRPALRVKETVQIELSQDDTTSKRPEVAAEMILAEGRRGVLRLRGFTCHLGDGRLSAVHESTDHSYYSVPDEGAPYYALMSTFMEIPFTHLAIWFGDEDPQALWMELHQMAPWVRPTAVSEAVRDGRTLRQIRMTSDFEDMSLLVDPQTGLLEALDLSITGGTFVQPGVSLRYRHRFEYGVPQAPFDESVLAFDPGERQRVDTLGALVSGPVAIEAPGPQQAADAPLVGAAAPDFHLATADGGAVDLAQLRGTVVVVEFWATWCGPCRHALPLLHEVAAWAAGDGLPVAVVTVNVWEIRDPGRDSPDTRLQSVREFWRKQGFTLPVAMDYADEVAARYGVLGIPTTVVVRPDGTVHAVHSGTGPDYVAQLKAEVRQAMEQPAQPPAPPPDVEEG